MSAVFSNGDGGAAAGGDGDDEDDGDEEDNGSFPVHDKEWWLMGKGHGALLASSISSASLSPCRIVADSFFFSPSHKNDKFLSQDPRLVQKAQING